MTTVAASASVGAERGRPVVGHGRMHPYARYARLAARVIPAASRPAAEEAALARTSAGSLKSLRFSRLEVTPLEVEMAAYVGFVLVGAIAGPLAWWVASLSGLEGLQLGLYSALPAGLAALLTLTFLAKFPENHARALRARTAGQMPEAISYLALSLELNPSLTEAIEFAARHAQEPIAGSLRNVLWRVYMRDRATAEEAFLDLAYEWGEWNEEFKKSLLAIRSAELEYSREKREISLEKATASMFKGARAMIEDFASTLSGPTTVFFAIGIILPMMIGSMLPLFGLSGKTVSPIAVIVLYDVVFPVASFAYSYSILQRRPGTSPPPEIDKRLTTAEKVGAGIGAGVTAAACIALGVYALQDPMLAFLGYLPFLWAAAFPLAIWAYVTTKRLKRERDRVLAMEQEYPDALYQIASRMGEGHPVEAAIEKTSQTIGTSSEIGKLLRAVTYRLQVMQSSLHTALFGPDGVLRRQPSRVVENTMQVVEGASRKEARTAGRTVINISAYLREMLTVERDIRMKLKDVTDTMLSTGVIFAPIVLGVTVALNQIIAETLAGEDLSNVGSFFGASGETEGAAAATLTPALFGLVVGIYLFFTLLVSTYFVSGIRHGSDRIEWKWLVAGTLPFAMVVYSAAVMMVGMFIA